MLMFNNIQVDSFCIIIVQVVELLLQLEQTQAALRAYVDDDDEFDDDDYSDDVLYLGYDYR